MQKRKTYVTVATTLLGVMTTQPQDVLYENKNLVTMNDIVQVRPSVPFRIHISNYSNQTFFLQKKQVF